MKAELTGAIVPLVTPFDDDEVFDGLAMNRLIDFVLDRGADGHHPVRVDVDQRLRAEELAHQLSNPGHPGGPADHHHVFYLVQTDAGITFVPLKIRPSIPSPSAMHASALRLFVKGDLQIEIGPDFDPQLLRRLITALRSVP